MAALDSVPSATEVPSPNDSVALCSGVVPLARAAVNVTGWSTAWVHDVAAPPVPAHVRVTDGAPNTLTVAAVDVFVPAVAVTEVSTLVVSCTVVVPLESVTAVVELSVPLLAEKVTGTPERPRPLTSTTVAMTLTVPPCELTLDGFVRTDTVSAAAAPMVNVRTFVAVLFSPVDADPAAPDVARTSAVPEVTPAENVAVAMPLRVSASTGDTLPNVVVKRTAVPFCTGFPLSSRMTAATSTDSFSAKVRFGAVSVTEDPVGANSAILSHAVAPTAAAKENNARARRFMQKLLNIVRS